MKRCLIQKLLLLWCAVLINSTLIAQRKNVTGNITDNESIALPGVTIVIKGTTTGTTSNSDGHYLIQAMPKDTLSFSFVGMETQYIVVGSKTRINVVMKERSSEIDQVVVIGYTTANKREISGAIASVQMNELSQISSPSLNILLSGKVAGMQNIVRSGVPGAATGGMVIRGNTSLSAANDAKGLSSPLYIVDGVPMSLQDLAGFNVTQNDFLSTLNPNEIASISVLKDASATAIYGARGANGVIIINTKKGVQGPVRFSFSSINGVVFQPEPLKVYIGEAERQEKIRLINESMTTLFGTSDQSQWIDVRRGYEPLGYAYPAVLTDKTNPYFNNAYDFQDIYYRQGLTQDYSLSMSGGDAKNAFRLGLGYNDQKGIVEGYGFKRITVNFSLNSNLSKRIRNDFSIRATYLDREGGSNDFQKTFPQDPTRLPSSLYYLTENQLNLARGSINDILNTNKNYTVALSEALQIMLVDGLRWENRISQNVTVGKRNYFVPSYASETQKSEAIVSTSLFTNTTLYSVFSFDKVYNEVHRPTVLVGTEAILDRNERTDISATNGPSNAIKTINGYNIEDVNGSSDYVKTNMLSFFGSVGYLYNDKYKIEGVVRRDGSSRFGADNKWATFPSIKAYWIFSKEGFLSGLNKVLTFGKIRASFGTSGNQHYDPLLQYNSLIGTTNIGAGLNNIYANLMDIKTYGGGSLNVLPDFSKLANNTLSWERNNEFNYGIDLELFKSKLFITADLYSKYISGLVYTSNLPSYTGYTSVQANLVDMINNGWELNLNYYIMPRGNDFQWEWTFNVAQNNSYIAKLGNAGRDYINGNYAFVEGQSAFQYYTYEYLGVVQDVADLPVNPLTGQPLSLLWADAGLALNQQGKYFPGMPLFADANGDYQIDGGNYGYDKKIIRGKSPEPKIYGGVNTNIKYKGWALRIQSHFAAGHYIYNTALQSMLSTYDETDQFYLRALYDLSSQIDFWEKPGDKAYYPMRYIAYSDGGSMRSFRNSSMFIEKGDYFSIDNITLSYNLPSKWIKRVDLKNVRVYATMQQPFMWKASLVPDPRTVSKNGYYNGNSYPISKSLVFGTNINF